MTKKFKYKGFIFELERTDQGVIVVDYDCESWFLGNLERGGLLTRNSDVGFYESETKAKEHIESIVDNVFWYACKEVKRGYVWYESGIGMWNHRNGWGAKESCGLSSRAMIMSWEDIQQFPKSQRCASYGGTIG